MGWLVDRYLQTTPIFTFVGLLAGITAAGSYTYVAFRKLFND